MCQAVNLKLADAVCSSNLGLAHRPTLQIIFDGQLADDRDPRPNPRPATTQADAVLAGGTPWALFGKHGA